MTGTELEDLPPAPKRPLLRDIALWPVLQAVGVWLPWVAVAVPVIVATFWFIHAVPPGTSRFAGMYAVAIGLCAGSAVSSVLSELVQSDTRRMARMTLAVKRDTLVLRAAIAQLDDGADAVHHVGSGCRCVWWGKHINPICVTVAPCERVTW